MATGVKVGTLLEKHGITEESLLAFEYGCEKGPPSLKKVPKVTMSENELTHLQVSLPLHPGPNGSSIQRVKPFTQEDHNKLDAPPTFEHIYVTKVSTVFR